MALYLLLRYGYNDSSQGSGYGPNYQSYHKSNDSLKGKLEQKYWKTKQKVIEKLKKDQDEFVVAGDADVDARLEAYKHINMTCNQLMMAVELYQNRIFGMYLLKTMFVRYYAWTAVNKIMLPFFLSSQANSLLHEYVNLHLQTACYIGSS